MLIYGGREVPCDSIDSALKVLFVLNRAKGDFIPLKTKCLQFLNQIRFENILDILKRTRYLIERDRKLHETSSTTSSLKNQSNGVQQFTLLEKVKEYCLDFLGTRSNEPGFAKFVENDMRMNPYYKLAFKRRFIRGWNVDENANQAFTHPLLALWQSECGSDIRIGLGDVKLLNVHKTVLLNCNNTCLSRIVSEHENSTVLKEAEEMEYILQYCYGFLQKVPPRLFIPLIKKAHQCGMNDLIPILQSELHLTVGSYFKWSYELREVMENAEVRRQFAEFGVKNGQSLFTDAQNYENIDRLRSELKNDLIVHLDD